ncbi:rod shape-determining protein MreB [Pseudonocardia thermophila]|uniref:Cell shape-determining protein MreB n=1 Tax=Pseudonocardia thermophila TaxID=1848 RepID=A0A1M6PL87_PSETH|nr:rod shape-determining protein MreB [Pseudonocardia thermophila]SHK08710.1 rod shape-determining protein MreB [Pseudonocardia thermophila]
MIELGIDLGTANTIVCDTDAGIVLDEPSVLLQAEEPRGHRRVVTVGRDASSLLGRTAGGVRALRPVQDGVIVDTESAETYLRALIRRVAPRPWQRARVRAVIGVPSGATPLERQALIEAADEAGIRRATVLDEPVAGAVGCGIDPLERRVHMVVDIGAGTSEVTAFCYGGVLATRSCRIGGDEMTTAVAHHLRDHHLLLVGDRTAEAVKIQADRELEPSIVVQGRDSATSRPKLATIPVAEIAEVIRPISQTIVQTLAGCLDDLPPEAVEDILADGVQLFGGASLTRGFDAVLENAFGFPVKRAGNPLTCVAEGAARCLQLPDVLRAYGIS